MRLLGVVFLAVGVMACGGEGAGGNGDDAPLFPTDGHGFDFGKQDVETQDQGGKDDGTGSEDVPVDGRVGPDGSDPGDSLHDGDGTVGPGFGIRIVSPVNGAEATGAVTVRIEPLESEELKLDNLAVKVNGTLVFSDTKVPTDFVLDTGVWPDGDINIEATGTIGTGEAGDQVLVKASNPPFGVFRVNCENDSVRNGDEITLFIEAGATDLGVLVDLSPIDSGYSQNFGVAEDVGNGLYKLTYKITSTNTRMDGTYSIPIQATNGVSTRSSPHFTLTLQNQPAIPVRAERSIFVSGGIPAASPNWVQPVGLVYGNDFIITGGSAKVNVDFSGYARPKEIVGILVAVEGYGGYYQKPVWDSDGEEEFLLLLRAYSEAETPPEKLKLQIAVRDIRGRVSQVRSYPLSVQHVGSGDVQVSVSWDSPTDVDLHVLEPSGCELYYGHKTCTSGGWLDLDSNPACAIDNINNENVFWPAGSAPTGTYTVRIDFYDDCDIGFGGGKAADYTVTMHYCGKVDIVYGHFDVGEDDSGGAGSGVEVAKFSNELCGKTLKGRVRYEDRPTDRNGTVTRLWKPVRFATVEVRSSINDAVLATTYTDRWGRYEVFFTNLNDPGIYIKVLTKTNYNEGLRKINVMNHPKFKKTYGIGSPVIDETSMATPEINFDIKEVDGAGAFNILDVVEDGYDLIRLMIGKDLAELSVFWATGTDTTDTIFCSEYFYDTGACSDLMSLSVQGKETDRDEYDDMVILKEFFKFGLAVGSKDDNPGGYHDGTRDDPRRSWTEGVSTFFPCDVFGTEFFVNSRPKGVYIVYNLEAINLPFAFSSVGGSLDGALSEHLVSSALWDMADYDGFESFDIVNGKRLPIYDSVFNYIAGPHTDRGFEGVDFVDFLDGWFCRAWGENIGMMKLVKEHYNFFYDLGGPSDCFTE